MSGGCLSRDLKADDETEPTSECFDFRASLSLSLFRFPHLSNEALLRKTCQMIELKIVLEKNNIGQQRRENEPENDLVTGSKFFKVVNQSENCFLPKTPKTGTFEEPELPFACWYPFPWFQDKAKLGGHSQTTHTLSLGPHITQHTPLSCDSGLSRSMPIPGRPTSGKKQMAKFQGFADVHHECMCRARTSFAASLSFSALRNWKFNIAHTTRLERQDTVERTPRPDFDRRCLNTPIWAPLAVFFHCSAMWVDPTL